MGMLGGLFGGRKTSMTSAARRASAASDKVGAAEDKVEELQAVFADLQAELDAEMAGIRSEWEAKAGAVGHDVHHAGEVRRQGQRASAWSGSRWAPETASADSAAPVDTGSAGTERTTWSTTRTR